MHVLDLPNIRRLPTASELLLVLQQLSPRQYKNFESSLNEEPQPGLFAWLTGVIASPLDWIADGEESADALREQIWELASTRLSERCGRTASPSIRRQMEVTVPGQKEPMIIEMIEPALTEDSLGLKTWGSALVLANRLARDHAEVLADPVLELGSGTGLTGIAAAKLGHDICVTDLPEIVPNLRANVDLNCTAGECIIVQALDWQNPEGFPEKRFKTIMVADPIYSPDHPQMVCNMLRRYLDWQNPGARVCVQLPLRPKFEADRDLFYTLVKEMGLRQVKYEVESGSDDFGPLDFAWSFYVPESSR